MNVKGWSKASPACRGTLDGGSQNHNDWWMSGPAEGLDAPEVHYFSEVGYGLGLATPAL